MSANRGLPPGPISLMFAFLTALLVAGRTIWGWLTTQVFPLLPALAFAAIGVAFVASLAFDTDDVVSKHAVAARAREARLFMWFFVTFIALSLLLSWQYDWVSATILGTLLALAWAGFGLAALYTGYKLIYRLFRQGGYGPYTRVVRILVILSTVPIATYVINAPMLRAGLPRFLVRGALLPSNHPAVGPVPIPGAIEAGITMAFAWPVLPPLIAATAAFYYLHAVGRGIVKTDFDG